MTRSLPLLAAVILFALCACSSASQMRGRHPWTVPGVLRFTIGQDVDSLNPTLSSQLVNTYLSELTQGYLFVYDRDFNLVPSLALQIPSPANGLISPDGKTITYHLRKGVLWQDGAPFTSADLAFSVKTILDPAYNDSNTFAFDQIVRVQTPDPYTFVVRLKDRDSAFVSQFLTPNVGSGILPQHLLAGRDVNRSSWNALPIGLGPFRYTRWARGSEIEMTANPRWWGGRPKLNRIVYRIVTDPNAALNELRSHELDAFALVPNEQYLQAAAIAGTRTYDFASTGYEHVDFNLSEPVLADVRVRRALAAAIDRATIVQKVDHGSGYLACSPVPHTSWAYDASVPCPSFDLRRAQQLLDSAGWHLGAQGIRWKNGEPLRLTLASTVGNLSRDETAVLIQSWFRAIGVDLAYRRYQANQLFSHGDGILSSGRFDLALYSWYWGADPDPSAIYACASRAPAGQNYSRYCNPQVDALLQDARVRYDVARRTADYRRVQAILAQDLPCVILYQAVNHLTINSDFRNVAPGPGGIFPDPAALTNQPS